MAKRNKISVNAKYYKGARIERIADHNNRIERINYLLEKQHHKHKNINIVYNNSGDLINKKYKFTPGDYLVKKFENNQLNISDKDNSDLMKLEFYSLQQIKQQIQREKRSYTKPNENDIFEMVVALSEEQAKFYLDNGIDLMTGFDMYMKDLQDKYGFTPVSVNLHLDEGYINHKNEVKYNIHAHCVAFNYDFSKGKSVLRNLRKKDFQDMQTMAQDSFQKVGLDFVRGKEKTIKGKDHLEQNDYILNKQNKLILENNTTLEIQSKTLEELESGIDYLNNHINDLNQKAEEGKELVKDINNKKQELKALLKDCEKGSEEYKSIYKEIGLIQQEEQAKRESLNLLNKEIKEKKEFSASLTFEKEELIENISKIRSDEKAAGAKLEKVSGELDSKTKELSGIKSQLEKESKELETIKETKKKVSIASRDNAQQNIVNIVNKLFKKRIKQGLVNGSSYLKLNEKELKDFQKEVYEELKEMANIDFIVEDSKKTKLENFDLKAQVENYKNDLENEKLKSSDWINEYKKEVKKVESLETSLEEYKNNSLKDFNEIKELKEDKESLTKQKNRALNFIKNKGFEDEFKKLKVHHIDR